MLTAATKEIDSNIERRNIIKKKLVTTIAAAGAILKMTGKCCIFFCHSARFNMRSNQSGALMFCVSGAK